MVERFTAKHFCGGFLYEEMAVWVIEQAEGLFSLRVVHLMCSRLMTKRRFMKGEYRLDLSV